MNLKYVIHMNRGRTKISPVSQNTPAHFPRMEYFLEYALWGQIPVCRHLQVHEHISKEFKNKSHSPKNK